MPYNPEPLAKAVEKVRKKRKNAERTVSVEEMAEKVDVTTADFLAYLSGEAEIPSGLPHRLMKAYGMGISTVTISSTRTHSHKPPWEWTEEERQERNHTSLTTIFSGYPRMAKDLGFELSEEEVARKAGISQDLLQAYRNREVPIPDEVINDLHDSTKHIRDAAISKQMRNNLMHLLPDIRNKALEKGFDITLSDMLSHMGLSNEDLYAYLSGEQTTAEDYSLKLQLAYPDLHGEGTTEVKEELFIDDLNRTVRLV